jgi:Fe-S-cluster containining protein
VGVGVSVSGKESMLKKILPKEVCAKCQDCCRFDTYELWEMPSFEILPEEIPHFKWGNMYRIKPIMEGELYNCPFLDPESGCKLGNNKPFECKIWPFRIMEYFGSNAICISDICGYMMGRTLKELREFATDLSPWIYDYAKKHPEIIKPYNKSYPVLLISD